MRRLPGGPVRGVAALYDVHGNLPALDAALAAVKAADVDLVLFGGDLALGPMPSEVLDRIMSLGDRAMALSGNCDRLILAAIHCQLPASLPASVRASIHWAAKQLDTRQREYLASLPATIELDVESLGSVLFCHATPRSDEEVFTARTPDARLREMLASVTQDVVVCGHTHMQFDRRCGDVRVLNAGSVGMPYGERGAHWLLVGESIEPRRTGYDPVCAAERIAQTGYPDAAQFAARHVVNPPTEDEMLAVFEPAT